MKKPIILIGGGGHCRSCIDVIESEGRFKIIGVVDVKERIGETVLDYKVIGADDDLPVLISKYRNALITIGQIKSPDIRISLFNKARDLSAKFPLVISSFSRVSPYSKAGPGTIIMHSCIVNAGAVIGENCIINTSAIIEHDATVGNNCHISTACTINGSCTIGHNVFIGSKTVVLNNVTVCDNVIIGAGSLIHKDIIASGTYAGNPLRKIK